jgi:hypothetical protein
MYFCLSVSMSMSIYLCAFLSVPLSTLHCRIKRVGFKSYILKILNQTEKTFWEQTLQLFPDFWSVLNRIVSKVSYKYWQKKHLQLKMKCSHQTGVTSVTNNFKWVLARAALWSVWPRYKVKGGIISLRNSHGISRLS